MRRLIKLKRFWTLLLLPIAWALIALAQAFPAVTERYYARGVYKVLSGLIGRITSLLPVSVTELLIYIMILLPFVVAIRLLVRQQRRKREVYFTRKQFDKTKWTANTVCILSSIAFLFALFCGPNYHRITFAEQSGLDVRPSSTEELAALTTSLAQRANDWSGEVARDSSGVMQIEDSSFALARRAQQVYNNAAEYYPVLGGYTPRPKPVLLSRGMSYLNITGIYIPFLFEANINMDTVDYQTPFTMMHEISHYKGFMREDEANFLAYLACRYSDDAEFAYSGTMLALTHASNALYRADSDLYYEVMQVLGDEVRIDLQANSAYWKQFEGPVAEVATTMNDAYLKANKQEAGVQSYGRMVDLLLAEYREENGPQPN